MNSIKTDKKYKTSRKHDLRPEPLKLKTTKPIGINLAGNFSSLFKNF